MDRKLAALVICNADYPGGAALKNPKNDADDLSQRFEQFGFSVIKAVNCTNRQMDRHIKSFKLRLKGNDVGLFFLRSRRGKLSDEGRKRLALAMKKRWAAAKKAGKQRLT